MVKERLPISVVIPTYNSWRFIQETVITILSQTVQCAEIIIVDDHSTDSTLELLNEIKRIHSNSIRIYCLRENVGSSEARNIGFRLANEPWVLLMDHDDLAEPDLVETEWARLQELETENRGRWVLVHSAYYQITETGEKLPGIHSWQQVAPEEILGYELLRNRILSNSGVILNRCAALSIGGYDLDLKYSQDWDLWLRMAQLGGFGYVDKPLIKVRRHANNTSRKVESYLEDELRILKKYDLDFIENAINRRRLPREMNRTDYVSVLYRMGYWDKGYSLLQEILHQYPSFPTAFFLMALYHLHYNQWGSASLALEQTLELKPGHGAALNNLGALKGIRGELEQAEALLQKALSLFPGYLDAQYNLQKLSGSKAPEPSDLKFTWRELRPVLVTYGE